MSLSSSVRRDGVRERKKEREGERERERERARETERFLKISAVLRI